jgi:hypothetical protein
VGILKSWEFVSLVDSMVLVVGVMSGIGFCVLLHLFSMGSSIYLFIIYLARYF